MTEKELIELAVDRANWSDDFLLMLRQRITENKDMAEPLYDELRKNDVDAVALGRAMDAAVENQGTARAPTKNVEIIPAVNPIEALVSVQDIEAREAEWMIPGYIPRNQITILAGAGGAGKTTIECALCAAVTTGKQSFLTADIIPADFIREPETVLFLSAEDDFATVLKRKLESAGADVSRIITVPISAPVFRKLDFGSAELDAIIKHCKPGLVIFDPIQEFIPRGADMSSRNEMRKCLSTLAGYCEDVNTSFLIACHANKQQGRSGRGRIADSADIWDIARSVLMVGETGEGEIRYLSQEKCNYGELQKTVLYELNGTGIVFRGRSDLKDADYQRKDRLPRPAPARDEAKELILRTLEENSGQMKAAELDGVLTGQGVTVITLKRAKAELKKERAIRYWKSGFASDEWMVAIAKSADDTER